MQRMKHGIGMVLLGAALAASSGCVVIGLAAAGGAAYGIYEFVNGATVGYVKATPDEVLTQAKEVLGDMGMVVLDEKVEQSGWRQLKAKSADGKETVTVRAKREGGDDKADDEQDADAEQKADAASKVTVRVGVFGDKEKSDIIWEKIAKPFHPGAHEAGE